MAQGEMSGAMDTPFNVHTTVFTPDSTGGHVALLKGERLFVMTDKGLSECPHTGPDNIYICAEHFDAWPVVAIRVRKPDVEKWRAVSDASRAKMMERVRKALAARAPSEEA